MTETTESLPELLADHHAAMPTARAAERDREVRLPFALVAWNEQREEAVELVEELACPRLREHVLTNGRIETRERAQLLDPVRVGQEPAVEHEIHVEREAVL